MLRLVTITLVCLTAMLTIPACTVYSQAQPQAYEQEPLAGQPHAPRVLVFPFAYTGGGSAYDWVGRGIQQSLLADLSSGGTAQVVFPATQPAAGPVNPLAVGGQAGANVVVVGTYQVSDNDVRITGEVFDVATGRNLGGLKATGPISDLFHLEDTLNQQLMRVLPPSYANGNTNSNGTAAANNAVASADQPASTWGSTTQPSVVVNAQVQAPPVTDYVYSDPYYYYPDYYTDAYPYYYGAWPFFGFVGVYSPWYYHGYYGGFRGGYYGGGHFEHPFYGGYRGGFAGGYHGGFGGGFHGGFAGGGFGGGFHGGGGFGGGHR